MRARGQKSILKRVMAALIGAAAMFGVTSVLTAPAAHALGPGMVCMFKAPGGASGWGHVGWGFRVGDSTEWIFGATEDENTNWSASGSRGDMENTFRKYGSGNYYTEFRCKSTATSAVGAARRKIGELYAQVYQWYNNNCLTRSIAIFNTYDGSLNLHGGAGVGPNWYYDNLHQAGFGPRHNL